MRLHRVMAVWLCCLSAMAAAAGDRGRQDPPSDAGYPDKPAWFKQSFLDVGEDVAEARAGGKRLILYFYQDGCPYCAKLLKDNFGNRAIARKTQKNFDVVAINMWGDREVTDLQGRATTEKRFAAALHVQYTPTLLMLNERGRTVLRINGYFPPHKFSVALDYVAGHHEQQEDFNTYYASKNPVEASGRLHRLAASLPEPLRLKENREHSHRPLLVLFEQRVCPACDELHGDIFRREALAYALTDLDVAVVDMWSDKKIQLPDGRMMPVRDWARELKVDYAPSLVFFDSDGKEVFRTGAYLKSFHLLGAIDYVVSGAYRWQPNFQRYLQHRTEVLHARGMPVDLMQ